MKLSVPLALLLVGFSAFSLETQAANQSVKLTKHEVTPSAIAKPMNTARKSPVNTFRVRYERYGVFGIYHVSLRVEILKDGIPYCKLHVDGAGRLTQYSLLGLKFRMPPAFLAGSVNPRGYKMHFLGLLPSEEFGPTYVLNEQQGNRLLSLAHYAITDMNSSDKLLYCTKPFRIGALGIPSLQIGPIKTPALQTKPVQFWTSNSVVASLVDIVNKEGINLPKPTNGCYPGFDGPFLPKSQYEYNKISAR